MTSQLSYLTTRAELSVTPTMVLLNLASDICKNIEGFSFKDALECHATSKTLALLEKLNDEKITGGTE